ncbi:MAG: DUF58 domain-containing protein, partial [Nitrososphaerota archaeon]
TNKTQHTMSLMLTDRHEGFEVVEGTSSTEAVLQPGSSITVSYTVKAKLRGEYEIGPATLRVFDAHRFWLRRLTIGPISKVVVSLPLELWVRAGDSGLMGVMGSDGSGLNRLTGADDVFRGVRRYAEGDPVRRVAWKRTARDDEHELYLKEYEHYSRIKVSILLDCSYSMVVENPTLLDICLVTIATLARAFLTKGDGVTVATFGAESNVVVRSESYAADYPTILKALSEVRPGGPYDLSSVMRYNQPADITIVLSRFAFFSARSLKKLEEMLAKTCPNTLLISPFSGFEDGAGGTLGILAKLEEARLASLRMAVPALHVFRADSLLPNILNLYRLYSARLGGVGLH